jgi:translation initiation factor IF-2
MNVTELARILKITPQELRYYLPKYGFDVGAKAIKINKIVAKRVIKEWPQIRKKIAYEKREAERIEAEKKAQTPKEIKKVEVGAYITVRDFAEIGALQISEVLAQLMKNGIFASLNEKIDHETAWLIGQELGVDVKKKDKNEHEEEQSDNQRDKLKEILKAEDKDNLIDRAPVIVVMGHVDHGKTKLLDAIRRTDIVGEEAGGITQHIGAYQVKRKDKFITFIDTPGHEAFTAMRSRGAKIADIAILVVAADDGVKPQTIEAFKIVQAAKIPFVIAINKIDKPGADIDRTKQELANKLGITPEDWGGKTICAPISALKGEGINDLLDIVLLLADTEIDTMKANPRAKAVGSIIESHLDKGAGPVATILVQNGTLNQGDDLILEKINIGRVRNLKNYNGENIVKALPSQPAQIVGLKTLPQVGDLIEVGKGLKVKARKMRLSGTSKVKVHEIESENDENIQTINLVIKGDVLGSIEAIEESLAKINLKDVRTKIIYKGLGNIAENDITRAEAANGRVIGFNVKLLPAMEEIARDKKVEIKLYSIIYDLINELKEEMKGMRKVKYERVYLGMIEVLEIFRTDKDFQIIGGVVQQGKVENGSEIEVFREDEYEGKGNLVQLQSAKQEVSYVEKKEECGMRFEGDTVVQKGDTLKFYKMEEVKE